MFPMLCLIDTREELLLEVLPANSLNINIAITTLVLEKWHRETDDSLADLL